MTHTERKELENKEMLRKEIEYYSAYLNEEYERERRAEEFHEKAFLKEWNQMFDGWELIVRPKNK